MTLKKVYALALIGHGIVHADITGLKELRALFSDEVTFMNKWQTAVENNGTLSPIINAEVTRFIHKNNAQLMQECELYFRLVRGQYTVAKHKEGQELYAALLQFLTDPKLGETHSGKEILALDSYKKLKKLNKESFDESRRFHARIAGQLPLLAPVLQKTIDYLDILLHEKTEKAIACLAWDGTFAEEWEAIANAYPQIEVILQQSSVMLAEIQKNSALSVQECIQQFDKASIAALAMVHCLGNKTVLQALSGLRIIRNEQDIQRNQERLAALLSVPEVLTLITSVNNYSVTQ